MMAVQATTPADAQQRVVIIDDDDLFRESLGLNLAEEGYDVVDFPSGESALDYLLGGQSADAVLLDWRMPGVDGLALVVQYKRFQDYVRSINDRFNHLRIDVLTAWAENHVLLSAADREKSILVEHPQIARVEPSAGCNDLRCALRIPVVTRHESRALNDDLSYSTFWIGIFNPNLNAREHRTRGTIAGGSGA